MDETQLSALEHTAELTVAWLSNPNTRASIDDVVRYINIVHTAMAALDGPAESVVDAPEFTAATTVRKSLASPDKIVSMIDGKPYTSLRRHLSTNGLTPDTYRARYKLPASYPMVASGYSAKRSEMAKAIGLGRPAASPPPVEKPKRARKSPTDAKAAAQAHLGVNADEPKSPGT